MDRIKAGITNEVFALLDEAHAIRVNNLKQSIILALQAKDLCAKQTDDVLLAGCLSRLAFYYMINGEYDRSLTIADEAAELFTALNDERAIADVKYTIASVYYKTDNLHLGLKYLSECLTTYRKHNDYLNLAKSYKVLGTIYEFFENVERAVESYEAAIAAAEKSGDNNMKTNAYNPLSGLYLNQGKTGIAMELIEASISLKQATGDTRGLAFSYYGRGKIHTRTGDYAKAEADFTHAVTIHLEMGEKLGLGMAYQKMGVLYIAQGKLESAKVILLKALELSETYKSSIIKTKSSFLLYQVFKQQHNADEALHYLELHQAEQDNSVQHQTKQMVEAYALIQQMEAQALEEKMRLERAEMLKKKNQAEYAARAKQDFLSNMSHEIRTPLNAVITITNLLKERADAEDQRLLDSLKFASNNLLLLINDVLDFTKLETGKVQLEKHPVLLHDLLHNIKNTYDSLAKEKGIRLDMQVDEKVGNVYWLDETKLAQILGNLLSNAIKFTDEGSVTLLVAYIADTAAGTKLAFKVCDTGIGIGPDFLMDIFDTFTQPKSVTTKKRQGSGLGLAIVKKLVELYDSNIAVSTQPGIGSVFSFELLLKPAERIVAGDEVSVPQRLSELEVLLVEDNAINTLVATKLLQRWNIKPDCAKNGLEAVAKSKLKRYDLILMDIHMPEMNGYDATIQLRQQDNPNCTTPVYALTADINVNLQEEYVEYFTGFLRKPIEVDHLLGAISSVIRSPAN